jgi:hypothetical protein
VREKTNGDCTYGTELGLAGWCVLECGYVQAEFRPEMEKVQVDRCLLAFMSKRGGRSCKIELRRIQ